MSGIEGLLGIPEILEIICCALFGIEHIDDNILVVDKDPAVSAPALYVVRIKAVFFLEDVFDLFRERLDVGCRVTAYDNEVISKSGLVPDIDDLDINTLLAFEDGNCLICELSACQIVCVTPLL